MLSLRYTRLLAGTIRLKLYDLLISLLIICGFIQMTIDIAVKRNVDIRQTQVFRSDCPKSLN